MASKNTNMKIFVFLAAAALLSALASADNSQLINQVCAKHSDGNFCREELGKATFSDISGLATVSIDDTKARAVDTDDIKALQAKETRPLAKEAFDTCLKLYDSAAGGIEEARLGFNGKDYQKMYADAEAVSKYAGICENAFIDRQLASPLTAKNKGVQNSAEIVEIVANILNGSA